MKKKRNLILLFALSVFTLIFLASSFFGMAAKKESVKEWIRADDGGEISLNDVTISFDPGVLNRDTKIHIIYFGEGEYQLGPEIKVNGTFTLFFANAPSGESTVMTFEKGEWIEIVCKDGYVETNHFSRYRGAW